MSLHAMNMLKLLELAHRVRGAIESVPEAFRPVTMQQFPRGACGDSALLLGTFLVDCDVFGFPYVCGERGCKQDDTWISHAWLQCGSCVLDITADQFVDAPSSVIVADPSPWHGSFEIEPPKTSDFRKWSGVQSLRVMYARMQPYLSSKGDGA